MATTHSKPALHNAMWPGIVGKGPDSSEPFIDLDTMLDLTAGAEVDGQKFDGVDLFMSAPHTSIDSTDDDLKVLADKLTSRNLKCGSFVAPVWGATGGGSAMGSEDERKAFLTQVRKACAIGQKMRDMGVRPSGVIRIDSATGPTPTTSILPAARRRSPTPLPKPATSPRAMASVSLRKAKSAGPACMAGTT